MKNSRTFWKKESEPTWTFSWIQINVDAAVRTELSVVATVAHDASGFFGSIVTGKYCEINLLVAKVRAVLLVILSLTLFVDIVISLLVLWIF